LKDGKSIKLTTLRVRAGISNGATEGRLPDRIKLLSWGENPSVKGVVRVTEATAAALAANQAARGFAEVALDFEHNTVPGSPEYERSQEPRRVAAYGVPRVVAEDGLWLEQVRWTPAGQAEALNYADLSPAVETAADGTVRFVHSAALTRNGAVEGLSFFSVTITQTKDETVDMSEKILTLSAVAAALGLSATADEATVCERIKILNSRQEVDLKPLENKITTLSAELEKLRGEVKSGLDAAQEREKGELVARFAAEGKAPRNAEGKAYTADELKGLDVPTLKILHANTPVTVALSARAKADGKGSVTDGLKGLKRTAAIFQEQFVALNSR
jgi:phage I-like protein